MEITIKGPQGCGKTEVAKVIADALYTRGWSTDLDGHVVTIHDGECPSTVRYLAVDTVQGARYDRTPMVEKPGRNDSRVEVTAPDGTTMYVVKRFDVLGVLRMTVQCEYAALSQVVQYVLQVVP